MTPLDRYRVQVDWKNPPRFVFVAYVVNLARDCPSLLDVCDAVIETYVIDTTVAYHACEVAASYHLQFVKVDGWLHDHLLDDNAREAAYERVDDAWRYDDHDHLAHVDVVQRGKVYVPIAVWDPTLDEEDDDPTLDDAAAWYVPNPTI